MGRSLPLRWRDMRRSVGPTSLPPTNTAGTGGLRPMSRKRAISISFPWVHPKVLEEGLHCVAHAAGARAEDHYRPLRAQLRDPIHVLYSICINIHGKKNVLQR
ncbi:unnamed protein product [Spirodela intermedia]|uniref:Uncharacterized protein n=2 Tax=Spirodela intermedia TaxID=51605 RepID=A0A7I8JYW3_SPIIN|nr:unnamed protein product [Spirodela intermedia]CAA6654233.1 unnamed protein product [Spirodela intermedia]CAA7388603.1 unnamed protein product [Spirodela intermedia]